MQGPNAETWDFEADVVAVGSGIAGLSAAISAKEAGASAIVVEASSQLGGVTAYSFGQIWIAGNHHQHGMGMEDSPESGFRYIKRLGMGFSEDDLCRAHANRAPEVLKFFEDRIGLECRVIRDYSDYYYPTFDDAVAEGRFLEVLPFSAETLGEWQSRTRLSPYVPYGMTHVDIFGGGGISNFANWDFAVMAQRLEADVRCLGPGLVGYFVKGAIDRDIPMMVDTCVDGLIEHDGKVVGVSATRDGKPIRIRAHRGVVLATSGIDGNADYERTLGNHLDVNSMVMPSVNGAHIRLAGRLGARIASVPDLCMFGYSLPGEEQEGQPLWRNAMADVGLPHVIVVNRLGQRFGDESFYRSVAMALDHADGGDQSYPNLPFWAVLDSQARAKYPFGSVMPGQAFPQGFAIEAGSLKELGALAGIDSDGLTATVERFNQHCAAGVDPDFGRGEKPWGRFICGDSSRENPNLGPIGEAPFYAVPLHRISNGGVAAAGLAFDMNACVLDYDDRPIPGLYVAGNAAARLDVGGGIQSGLSNARGMTQGFVAGQHAAGRSPVDV